MIKKIVLQSLFMADFLTSLQSLERQCIFKIAFWDSIRLNSMYPM